MLSQNASSITELMGSGSAPSAHIAKSSAFMVAGKVSSASGLPPDSSTSRDVEASDMARSPAPATKARAAETSRPASVSVRNRLSRWATGCPDLTANIKTMPSTSSRFPANISAPNEAWSTH